MTVETTGGRTNPDSARVLVVDDSAVIRQALKKMLTGEFDVVVAEHGETGWSRLVDDEQVKLLITDIEMPQLDGYGFICRVRASEDPRIRDLPIIAITGAEDEGTKVRAYACGANDFITKPLERMQLLRRAQAYIGFDDLAGRGTDEQTDPITGLASRQQFRQQGEQAYMRARQKQRDMVLLRADIDNFKQLYKQCGDDQFDQLLVWLSRMLRECAGPEDVVARVGGAEFALLFPGRGLSEGREISNQLLAHTRSQAFAAGQGSVRVTLSLGLAAAGEGRAESFEDLLRIVDERLHRAKTEGGDRLSEAGLGETLEQPEEVVLAAPEARMEDPITEEISVAGLDDVEFVAVPTENSQARVRDNDLLRLLSIDKALMLLAQGQHAKLEPVLEELVRQVLPLLEHYRDHSERVPAIVDDILRRFRKAD